MQARVGTERARFLAEAVPPARVQRVEDNDVNCPANECFDVPSRAVMGANVKSVQLSIAGIDGHKGVLYFDNIYFD